MIRFYTTSRLGCLAALIALPLLLFLLPFLLLGRLLGLFAPRPPASWYGAASPEPGPGDDIPASEAVIDVAARVVEESEGPSDNNRIGG